jgi:MFS family permease
MLNLMLNKSTKISIFLAVCWLYACIHLDRQTLAVLAESVKSDLHLQDRELGALTGSAFALTYALLGLYFGEMADRRDRMHMVCVGAWVWSLACIGGAFALDFRMLVVSRVGIAVGEAIATPAAVALIAEFAGEKYRARVASLFLTSAFVGAGSAAILGGSVSDLMHHAIAVSGWRAALFAAGVPGIAGALYLSRMGGNDPDRSPDGGARASAPGAAATGAISPAAGVLGVGVAVVVLLQVYCTPGWSVPLCVVLVSSIALWWGRALHRSNPRAFRATLGQSTFRLVVLSFAAVLFVDSAAGFWLIPYAQRRFGLSVLTVGTQMGSLIIAGGIGGCLAGGWIADRWRKTRRSGRAWAALLAVVAEAVSILIALGQSDYSAFVRIAGAFCIFSGAWVGVAAALAFDAVPGAHRGTGTSIYFLVTTLLGPAVGPFLVGWGSDALGSLGSALAWSCTVILIAVITLARLAARLERSSEVRLERDDGAAHPG